MKESNGNANRGVFRISAEAAEHLYQFSRLFWEERSGQSLEDGSIEMLLADYREAMKAPKIEPVRNFLLDVHRQVMDAELEFSMLELGAANGSILHFLKDEVGLDKIRYTGIEPWQPFVDDFNAHFPDQTMIQGNVDEAVDMTLEDLGGERFTVFFSSLVFCMINPVRTRKFIAKLSEISNCLIFQDSNLNILGSADDDMVTVIPFNPDTIQFYFANPFKAILEENGYRIASSWPVPDLNGIPGWQLFVAVK